MNVYDFDKTICKGDTEADFFKYCLIHYPINLLRLIPYLITFIKLKQNKISQEVYRERTYLSFKGIEDINIVVNKFWKRREKKILKWYLNQKKEDDVIISVTPEILLKPIFNKLNIKNYFCSQIDFKTKKVIGKMIYGEEKVRLFLEKYNKDDVDCFYTDSLTDLPMLRFAKHPYIVDKHFNIIEFKE